VLAQAAKCLELEDNCLDAIPSKLQGILSDKIALADALEGIVEEIVNFLWHDIERSITQNRYLDTCMISNVTFSWSEK